MSDFCSLAGLCELGGRDQGEPCGRPRLSLVVPHAQSEFFPDIRDRDWWAGFTVREAATSIFPRRAVILPRYSIPRRRRRFCVKSLDTVDHITPVVAEIIRTASSDICDVVVAVNGAQSMEFRAHRPVFPCLHFFGEERPPGPCSVPPLSEETEPVQLVYG